VKQIAKLAARPGSEPGKRPISLDQAYPDGCWKPRRTDGLYHPAQVLDGKLAVRIEKQHPIQPRAGYRAAEGGGRTLIACESSWANFGVSRRKFIQHGAGSVPAAVVAYYDLKSLEPGGGAQMLDPPFDESFQVFRLIEGGSRQGDFPHDMEGRGIIGVHDVPKSSPRKNFLGSSDASTCRTQGGCRNAL
jgi:hypothetical protein